MNQAVSRDPHLRMALVSGGLPLGGSSTFVCNLAGEFIRRGIPTEVLIFSQEHPLKEDFERLKIPVFCQDEHRLLWEDRLQAILLELSRFKPTVVLANLSPESFEVLRYLPMGVFRAGVIHSDDNRVYDRVKLYAGHLDLLATVSETIKSELQTRPEYKPLRIAYVPCGVPMPEAEPPQRDFEGPLRILYLGRLSQEQKRVRLFPTVLAQLKDSGIAFHWTIAGEGPERAWLETQMTSSSPEQRVSFLGSVPYASVAQVLAQNDIFLLASDYEGLPLALLEAMGQGLVPVVSDLPSGIRELVDADTGIRVAPEKTAGYAQAIISLQGDRPRMRELSRVARQKVRSEYSVAAMGDRWLGALAGTNHCQGQWPDHWVIQPPLGGSTNWRYTSLGRFLRRFRLKLTG
jgi:glycosyltransferase involved in cell wall biosynthesis